MKWPWRKHRTDEEANEPSIELEAPNSEQRIKALSFGPEQRERRQNERWKYSDYVGLCRKVTIMLQVIPAPSDGEWTTQDLLNTPADPSNIPSKENIEWVLNGAQIDGDAPTNREEWLVSQVQNLLLSSAEDILGADALALLMRPVWWWELVGRLHRSGESVQPKLKTNYEWDHGKNLSRYQTFRRSRPVLVSLGYVAQQLQVTLDDVHDLIAAKELKAAVGMEAIEAILYEFLPTSMAAYEANMWYLETLEEVATAIYADDFLRLIRPVANTGLCELTGQEDHKYHSLVLRRFRVSRKLFWTQDTFKNETEGR